MAHSVYSILFIYLIQQATLHDCRNKVKDTGKDAVL